MVFRPATARATPHLLALVLIKSLASAAFPCEAMLDLDSSPIAFSECANESQHIWFLSITYAKTAPGIPLKRPARAIE